VPTSLSRINSLVPNDKSSPLNSFITLPDALVIQSFLILISLLSKSPVEISLTSNFIFAFLYPVCLTEIFVTSGF